MYSKHDDEPKKRMRRRRKNINEQRSKPTTTVEKRAILFKRVPTYGFHIISTDLFETNSRRRRVKKTITQSEQVETNMLLNFVRSVVMFHSYSISTFFMLFFRCKQILGINIQKSEENKFILLTTRKALKNLNLFHFVTFDIGRRTIFFLAGSFSKYFGNCFVSNCLQIERMFEIDRN